MSECPPPVQCECESHKFAQELARIKREGLHPLLTNEDLQQFQEHERRENKIDLESKGKDEDHRFWIRCSYNTS